MSESEAGLDRAWRESNRRKCIIIDRRTKIGLCQCNAKELDHQIERDNVVNGTYPLVFLTIGSGFGSRSGWDPTICRKTPI